MVEVAAGQREDIVETAVTRLVMANRILANEDIIDNFGHVSMRHPLRPDRYLLSRARSPQVVTRADILEFTLEGEKVGDDPRRTYVERHIHGAIYKDRPEINAVVHHHARSVLPFTSTALSLRPTFHMASVIGAEVPRWDSQAEFGDTNMLVDSMEMAHSLSRTLGSGRAALMRSHGAVCAAENIMAAVLVAIGLRDNAELIRDAMAMGKVSYLTDGEIEKCSKVLLLDTSLARAWDYWVARAGYAGL